MVVLIVESVSPSLRGELSRWMIEPRAGVFVGSMSGMVRDKLWEKVQESVEAGGGTMVYTSNSEQGFLMRSCGETRREIVDCEGLALVRLPRAEADYGDGWEGRAGAEQLASEEVLG